MMSHAIRSLYSKVDLPPPHGKGAVLVFAGELHPDLFQYARGSAIFGGGIRDQRFDSRQLTGTLQQKTRHLGSNTASFKARKGEIRELQNAIYGRALETAHAGQLLRCAFNHQVSEPIRRSLERKCSHEI